MLDNRLEVQLSAKHMYCGPCLHRTRHLCRRFCHSIVRHGNLWVVAVVVQALVRELVQALVPVLVQVLVVELVQA